MDTLVLLIGLPAAVTILSIFGRYSIVLRVMCVSMFLLFTYVDWNITLCVSRRIAIEQMDKREHYGNKDYVDGIGRALDAIKERIPFLMVPAVVLGILSFVPVKRKEKTQQNWD
ncbi:MAG TPA: hypothetical protein DCZ95_04270 [Verrucomicrobia bacterium]|nr:MAG: hypothetical protein A2X46_07770 [Lentisphaerae bacterium GWF2_57_35]HBA83291.1 hypothetical protein [Verrucomicrobiota bacterium]